MTKDIRIPPLDLRLVKHFLALAEHGSISAAAAHLGMAQPSLSENIAKLERRLQVQLAVRGPRGIQLTEAGVLLARSGREIVDSAERLVDDIHQIGNDPRGPVSIGFTPSLGLLLAVPLAETIQHEHPSIRLYIAEAMSGHILEWIETDELELGCVYEVPNSAILSAQPILCEELFVVTAPDNWAQSDVKDGRGVQPISMADLQNLPLVLPGQRHGARKIIERFARSHGIRLNIVAEIDSLPQIVEMVSRASGYTILAHAAVVRQVMEGTLVLLPLEEPSIRRTAYLVRKRSRPVTRASTAVQAALFTIVREIIHRYRLAATLPTELDPETE